MAGKGRAKIAEDKRFSREVGAKIARALRERAPDLSQRKLAELLGMHQPQVSSALAGKLTFTLRQAQRLSEAIGVPVDTLLPGAKEAGSLRSVPILGRITAGPLVLAEAQAEGTIEVPRSLLPNGEAFALRVYGDSMLGAHVEDGDTVVLRATPQAPLGAIVAATIHGETALRRLVEVQEELGPRRTRAHFLAPESPNPAYKPTRIGEAGVWVHGVVTLLLRQYEVRVVG